MTSRQRMNDEAMFKDMSSQFCIENQRVRVEGLVLSIVHVNVQRSARIFGVNAKPWHALVQHQYRKNEIPLVLIAKVVCVR
jgi:hypothetical protein